VAKTDFKSINVEIAIYLLNLCLATNLPKMEDQNSEFKIIPPSKCSQDWIHIIIEFATYVLNILLLVQLQAYWSTKSYESIKSLV